MFFLNENFTTGTGGGGYTIIQLYNVGLLSLYYSITSLAGNTKSTYACH